MTSAHLAENMISGIGMQCATCNKVAPTMQKGKEALHK